MGGLIHDLRHALRIARLHPGVSARVVATMALGIGLNGAVFSLVDALLLRPAPVGAPERVVDVHSSVPGGFVSHEPMAFPDYETLRDRTRSFVGLAAYAWYPLAIERGDGSERVMAEIVTGNYFAVLEVVGHELRLNGRAFTVVGVGPAGFRSLIPGFAPDLWLPIHAGAALPADVTINFGSPTPGLERIVDRGQRWVWVTGRLRPDESAEQAGAEVGVLAAQLGRDFPATNARRVFTAVAAQDVRLSPVVDRTLWAGSLLLMGVFALGLLLASVNIASLCLARALGRRRETATRLALGAGRGRLVRQLFLEGLLLALAGGSLGLLIASVSNDWLSRVALPPAAGVSWRLDLVLAPALDA